jgi:hypothetical protein
MNDGATQKAAGRGPHAAATGLVREVGRGLVLVGLAGSSVGGVVGCLTLAARVLGR